MHVPPWQCAQVYGLAMYAEEAGARQELARLKAAGFFSDGDDSVEKMCSAIAAMKCHKVPPPPPRPRMHTCHFALVGKAPATHDTVVGQPVLRLMGSARSQQISTGHSVGPAIGHKSERGSWW